MLTINVTTYNFVRSNSYAAKCKYEVYGNYVKVLEQAAAKELAGKLGKSALVIPNKD